MNIYECSLVNSVLVGMCCLACSTVQTSKSIMYRVDPQCISAGSIDLETIMIPIATGYAHLMSVRTSQRLMKCAILEMNYIVMSLRN